MAKALSQILSWVNITKAIWGTTPGVPRTIPDAFYRSKEKVEGVKARYTRYTGERRTPKLVEWGAPARVADLRNVGEVDVRLMHFYEEQRLDPMVLMYLRSPDDYTQDKGLKEVKRQIEQFKKKFENNRTASVAQVLRLGSLYYDSDGNFLPSSSGAATQYTFNFQMNANNQNQCNGIFGSSWKLNSTDIPGQLRTLKKTARRLTGYKLEHAIYGENIPSQLATNNFVLDYMARNPTMNKEWVDAGEIPNGLFGFQWVPGYEMFYEDKNGVNQDLWDANTVVFTPEPDDNWWDVFEGSFPIPTTINIQAEGMAGMNSLKTVFGQGGYGIVTPNPPTVAMYGFDTQLPVLKIPDVIFQSVPSF